MNGTNEKILVIGLGEIGYNNAEYMSELGLTVEGYDINPQAIKRALDANIIKKEAKNFKGYDYYMICVSTHSPTNMSIPYMDGLIRVANRIAEEGRPGTLVAIESTIPKGTSKKVCGILQHRFHVAHCPHRYYNREKTEHGVRQLRVLAGCRSCCCDEAIQFYKHLLDIPIYTLSSVELAELTKVIENTHRYLEIAFAEELKMFCDSQNLDFTELRTAINTKWNENILEAREGIGGHCLPKDTRMYYELSIHVLPYSTISAALKTNDLYESYLNKKDFIVIQPTEFIPIRSQKSTIPELSEV